MLNRKIKQKFDSRFFLIILCVILDPIKAMNNTQRAWMFPLVPGEMGRILEGFKSSIINSSKLGESLHVSSADRIFAAFKKNIFEKPWPCNLPENHLIMGNVQKFREHPTFIGSMFLRTNIGVTYSHHNTGGMFVLLPRMKLNNPNLICCLMPVNSIDVNNAHKYDSIFDPKFIGQFLLPSASIIDDITSKVQQSNRYFLYPNPGMGIFIPSGHILFYYGQGIMNSVDNQIQEENSSNFLMTSLESQLTQKRILDSSKTERQTNIIQLVRTKP